MYLLYHPSQESVYSACRYIEWHTRYLLYHPSRHVYTAASIVCTTIRSETTSGSRTYIHTHSAPHSLTSLSILRSTLVSPVRRTTLLPSRWPNFTTQSEYRCSTQGVGTDVNRPQTSTSMALHTTWSQLHTVYMHMHTQKYCCWFYDSTCMHGLATLTLSHCLSRPLPFRQIWRLCNASTQLLYWHRL